MLHRAALASCSVGPTRAVANARRKLSVVRPQGISAGNSSPTSRNSSPRSTPHAWTAGARLAAPAPLRILIVRPPAVTCIKHSGDSQEEPAGREQPAASLEKQPADSKAPAAHFGRDLELQELARLAKSRPGVMHLVLGPRSSGKTRTLTEFQRTRQNVLKLDMRGIDFSTPTTFTSRVLEVLAQAAPRSVAKIAMERLQVVEGTQQAAAVLGGAMERIKVTTKNIGGLMDTAGTTTDVSLEIGKWVNVLQNAWKSKKPKQHKEADFNTFVTAITELLDAWQQAKASAAGAEQEHPMLIIAEANKLVGWKETHPRQLDVLLSILLRISKQEGLCHVVLATSDWGFTGWLTTAIGVGFYVPVVIRDFPEKEARLFFEWKLQQRGMVLEEATWEATWSKVFEVGGGNAGFLSQLAAYVAVPQSSNEFNWDTALRKLTITSAMATRDHAYGGSDLGWTRQQYATVALALLRAKEHAVPYEGMLEMLEQLEQRRQTKRSGAEGGGSDAAPADVAEQVLQRMIAANALAVRPFSDWARDVSKEAFEGEVQVVTAPSAVSLHCMRRLQQRLEEATTK